MRELNECKAEVFRRSEARIRRRRKIRCRILSVCAYVCLCLTFAGVGLFAAHGPETDDVPPPSYGIPRPSETEPSGTETDPVTHVSAMPEMRPTVITANKPDTFGAGTYDTEGLLSIDKIYISPMLEELMKQNPGADVLFRVAVEVVITSQDYDEYDEQARTNADELLAFEEKAAAAWDEYYDAWDEYCDFRRKVPEIYENEKELTDLEKRIRGVDETLSYARALQEKLDDLRDADCNAYLLSVGDKRLDYAKSIGAKIVMPLSESSDIDCSSGFTVDAYIMELSADMINDMAAQGGYMFRMAPPERKEGYDPKISDYLTTLLDQAEDDAVFPVAVVCTADRYNEFARERGIAVNREYNASLFQPLQIPENKDFEDYKKDIADYEKDIAERNNLSSERCSFGRYFGAGFEVQATKAEILSLIEDPDVKLICSMDFRQEYVPLIDCE